jgi:pimeloyl-ACP methyl ester carboxylesterase
MPTENSQKRLTRRALLRGIGTLLASSILKSRSGAAAQQHQRGPTEPTPARGNAAVLYGQDTLPAGIRSRLVSNNNGLHMHVLEAGFEAPQRPCVLLLHGFPELAYTWRHQLLPLAAAGFHVLAPDLRGYGLTDRIPVTFGDSLVPYMMLNRVADVLGLVRAVGHETVACVVGHDWGGPIAEQCTVIRPDVFRSVVNVSTPFGGPPTLPLNTADAPEPAGGHVDIEVALAALPRPRKHYWWYSASPDANGDMWHAPQGLHNLLRAMYYFKSADWKGNKPFALSSWSANELAKMPDYYVMDLHRGIAQTMAEHMPSPQEIAACRWLTDADLDVYASQCARTGFQGGLNSYRILLDSAYSAEMRAFSGRTIDVPACFIGGAEDWAVRQVPGQFEGMRQVCTKLVSVSLIAHAGHWVAEEQPETFNELLLSFVRQGHHPR